MCGDDNDGAGSGGGVVGGNQNDDSGITMQYLVQPCIVMVVKTNGLMKDDGVLYDDNELRCSRFVKPTFPIMCWPMPYRDVSSVDSSISPGSL